MWTGGRGQDSSSERMSGWFEFWGSREVERTREGIEYSRIQKNTEEYSRMDWIVDRIEALLPTTGTSSTIQLINRVEWSRMGWILSGEVERSRKGVE